MLNSDIKNFTGKTAIPTSIVPWLSVADSRKAVGFYKSAFGAVEAYRLEAPDGSLVARLSVDGAEFWLSEESRYTDSSNPATPGEGTVRMVLTVTNPDAVFSQALKAGALEVFAVGEEHGWRLGRLVDPLGHHWEIGRPLDT